MSIINKIQPFIFSWKGQYEQTIKVKEQFDKIFDNVIVINSDDENTPEDWINIGNGCYFSDQFRKALEIFKQSDKEFLWHIQADASFDNFAEIAEAADKVYETYEWGVYAPNVDDTYYIPSRTDVLELENNLRLVATTDNTCWIIHRDIVEDLLRNMSLMENNKLGWGWDLLICAFSHMRQRKVIRDYNYKINHPASTGYMKEQAEDEMQEMFRKCYPELRNVVLTIKGPVTQLANLYNIKPKSAPNMIIFDTESVIR
jgi:hypothetical protein